jgi:hypothetical protein
MSEEVKDELIVKLVEHILLGKEHEELIESFTQDEMNLIVELRLI